MIVRYRASTKLQQIQHATLSQCVSRNVKWNHYIQLIRRFIFVLEILFTGLDLLDSAEVNSIVTAPSETIDVPVAGI